MRSVNCRFSIFIGLWPFFIFVTGIASLADARVSGINPNALNPQVSSSHVPDSLEDRGANSDAASQIGVDDEKRVPDSLRLPRPRYREAADPFPRKRSPIIEIDHSFDETTVERDSLNRFHVRRTIHDIEVGVPRIMEFEEYAQRSLEHRKRQNWERLVEESERRRDDRRGLLDFTLDLPVDESSAFATIFGRPEVNLSVTGTANMDVGASIQETLDPSLPPDQQRRIDPLFNQNLQLNIEGTIGDKLFIRTDWDTERSFDWQNRLNIVYEGYEDEIIQSIELGNVSMSTGNSLIRGGSALFGIRSEAQFGPLTLTGIISQQEGDSQTETISGGSTESEISLRPTDYQEDRHFFLDFFSRQEFEGAMADPVIATRIFDITRMDVYLLNISAEAEDDQRRAIALTDLGTVEQGEDFAMPDPEGDPFDPSVLEGFRDPDEGVSASDLGVASDEFEEGYFIPLQEGQDYTYDETLGFISLETSISDRQAVAVSFAYRDPQTNEIVNVGDVNEGGSDRLFLKLLRPSNLSTSSRAWPLMMRNIYSLNATDLTPDDIELDVYYTGGNTDQTNLPNLGGRLLQDLGLDRVNSSGEPNPNNELDFNTGTLDARNGRIIFPYLEPFGERIKELYQNSNLPEAEIEEAIDRYAFPELYTETRTNAQRESEDNIYRLQGMSRGGVQESFNLGYALVEGSVTVTANGVELTEGTDYEVDYSIGSIIITNDRYLQSGQDIEIDYENQQAVQIQQTTFTGLRANYEVAENINLGGTYFSLTERPNQDKLMVGDEPVNSSILGFDGDAEFDAPWLTRALDWLPILSTREESSISISGEFAQLRPDVSHPPAIRRAIDNDELFSDEERGISYIDHFGGARRSIDLSRAGRWHLAAAPLGIPGYDSDMDTPGTSQEDHVQRSDMRAQFSWYSIPRAVERLTGINPRDFPETQPVAVQDVFPNRDVQRGENRLQTLDVHYNPHDRGPYNYNYDLRDLLENRREDMWGGMTTTLPSGQDNFRRDNIEFLEFWVQPVLPEGREGRPADIEDYEGKLYIDVGTINEDVMATGVLNSEDGLSRARNREPDSRGRSYVGRPTPDMTGQFSSETIVEENVGLDGAISGDGEFSEQVLFSDFLQRMEESFADDPEMLQRILDDPSNDQFVYFDEEKVADKPLHERFHRMHGYYEGNALSEGDRRPVTNRPNTEGLLNNARLNTENSYFQYEVNLNPADTSGLSIGENFIVDKVDGPNPTDRWYLVRIPLREYERSVGSIDDLERVSHIRMWMSGYEEPFTARFASMELVGNQWELAPRLSELDNNNTDFQIATINIEENANRQPIPYRTPVGAIRPVDRTQQEQTRGNEQSLQLNVENLQSGDTRFIRRSYTDALDLLNYSNLRMFVHGEGYENREDIELVLRFGNDLEDNYYEYRQPISPTDPNFNFQTIGGENGEGLDSATEREESDRVWIPDSNSVNIILSSLNALKQARDLEDVDLGEKYIRGDLLEDAAPGAEIAVKGNPSLGRVTEFAVGIRNPHGDDNNNNGVPSLDAEVWINELRVSGFDDEDGWAANVRARVDFADFARLNARYNRSTDGFGSLDSGLGARQTSDRESYNISTDVNLHRFIPERFGWNIPLALSGSRSLQTPRYLPQQGDIRFSDFEEAVRTSELSEEEQDQQINTMLRRIETYEESYSLNLSNISKSDSQSPFLRYTIDNTRFSYVYNVDERRNPNYLFQDSWDYRASADYNLRFPEISRLFPFRFLEGLPVLRAFSDVGFSYLPTSFETGANVQRRYREDQQRHEEGQDPFDLEQRHNFNLNTNLGFNYNLTRTISTSFNTNSSLDLAGIATEDFEDIDQFRTRPSFDVFSDIIFDQQVQPRRSDYQESYSASWSPNFNAFEYLDWFQYDASYRGSFDWQNSPEGSGLGATIGNNFNLDHSPVIRTQNLLERSSLYERLQEADAEAQQSRDQRREERNRIREEIEEAEDEEEIEQLEEEMPERDPAEDLMHVGRRFLLGLLSLRDININYSTSVNSAQGGFTGGTRIYHMFNDEADADFSPPFAYRTGFMHEIPESQLSRPESPDEAFDFDHRITNDDDLSVRTGLQPFQNVRVDLDWNVGWDDTKTTTFRVSQQDISSQIRESGNISAYVWAFGDGYTDLFRRQIARGLADLENSQINQEEPGSAILRSNSLDADFRDAYLAFGSSRYGRLDFIPLPLPSWSINWSGLEQIIPFLGDRISSASLNHNYSGRFRMGWERNLDAGQEVSRTVGQYTVNTFRSEHQPSSINMEQRFSPMAGLNLNWTGGLRTNIDYDFSKVVSFSMSNYNVTEQVSRGVRLSANYSQTGFRLPFLRRFSNEVDLGLTFSYNQDLRLIYRLNQDLGEVFSQDLSGTEDPEAFTHPEPEEQGDTRINITPRIGYQFSQTITVNFEYNYRRLLPKSSNVFPRTDQDFRFNIVVNIRSR